MASRSSGRVPARCGGRTMPPRHRRSAGLHRQASGRHKVASGRGRVALTASMLGLALAAGAVAGAAQVTAGAPSDPAAGQPQGYSSPFVMERATLFERAYAETQQLRTRPAAHPARGVPRRLVVPRLAVDARVVPVRAAGGVLRAPADPQVLGWWRGGARPGAVRGSALVTGHTVSAGGGALDNLEKLRAGDRVRVRTTAGAVRYEVTRVTIYRRATLAKDSARVFDQSVGGRLVLVTCEDWNGTSYLSNVVVVAKPV